MYVCTCRSSIVVVSGVAGPRKCRHGYVDVPVRRITITIKLKSSTDHSVTKDELP